MGALLGVRSGIFAAIFVLLLTLAVLGTHLFKQVQTLGTAALDDVQWTVTQFELEFVKFDRSLRALPDAASPAAWQVRRQFEILMSRLDLLGTGRYSEIFLNTETSTDLFRKFSAYAQSIDPLIAPEDALLRPNLPQMIEATTNIAPVARSLALHGLSLSAEYAQTRRTRILRSLVWTGSTAILGVILLSLSLILLDRFYQRSRKRDRKLRETTAMLHATVSASLDAIIVADSNGCVLDYNSAAAHVFGWAREEILGCGLTETLLPKRDRAAFKSQISANHNSPFDTGRFEATGLKKGGDEFPIELNLKAVKDNDRVNYIAYIRDISDRKTAEETLIQSRDQAKQANDAKSRFLAVMSHEMRTPLNGILGVLDLLRTAKDKRAQRRYIDIATASSEVLLQHVNEALDITRIETGETVIAAHPFNLRDLCTGIVEVLEPLAHEKGLSLHLTYTASTPQSFEGDASRVRQIITNLIGNAIKFTERGDVEVRVIDTSLRAQGAQNGDAPPFRMSDIRIDVMDTGRGIAPENLDRVFEDFVSLEAAKGRQMRGDGLGLSISRRFARLMGGNLIVQSTQGLGSTFTLLLKLHALGNKTAQTKDAAEIAAPHIALKHPVLIVEDNDVNRSVLCDMLKGFGLEVQEAQNGAEAVEMAQETQFDLILMDVSMPVMNGIDATRALRDTAGPNQNTRIIGLTAHGVDTLRDAATAAGMNAIFAKPIRLSTLRQIMFTHSTHIAPPVAVATRAEVTDIDMDYLAELVGVLGPVQANSVANQFFSELKAALGATVPPIAPTTWDSLAEAVHKIHGAAALLGLTDMAQNLQDLYAIAADEQADSFSARAEKTLKYGQNLQTRLAGKIDDLTPEHRAE